MASPCIKSQEFECEAKMPKTPRIERIWAISDIHTDCQENVDFIDAFDSSAFQRDALLVAGDVSHDVHVLRRTLRSLRSKFGAVFFVPGNHDLWTEAGSRTQGCAAMKAEHCYDDSLVKLVALEELCREEGVEISPRRLDVASPPMAPTSIEDRGGDTAGLTRSVWIVPLLSWHCASFDTEPDIDPRWTGIPAVTDLCSDYYLCKWPSPLDHRNDSIALHIDGMNDERMTNSQTAICSETDASFATRSPSDVVVSFSHFLPRIELLPEKRYLYFPNLSKMVGSPALGRRVAELRPDVHVFGHTHFGWDAVIDSVRYISAPLGMPREREQRVSTVTTGDFLEHAPPVMQPLADARAWPPHSSGCPDGPSGASVLKPGVLLWDYLEGFASRYDAGWSNFYSEFPREPDQVTVLPEYVARNYGWDEMRHGPKANSIGISGKTPAGELGPSWSVRRRRPQ